ncbi:MAG TPA: hypothetical protein VLY23_17635 [Candidatus Acidoferrum sp.]|nr:hypothetical protein [Candidatus Acidoferrum sp.]
MNYLQDIFSKARYELRRIGSRVFLERLDYFLDVIRCDQRPA